MAHVSSWPTGKPQREGVEREQSVCPRAMPPKGFDPLALQHNVRHNAEDIQSFVADLSSWEDSIKTKDKKLLKVSAPQPSQPERVRACVRPS